MTGRAAVGSLWVVGLLGSLHCIGMCGGFVLALDRPSRAPVRRLATFATFLTGKACTYVLLGALAGLAGGAVVHSGAFAAARSALAVAAGVLMVWAGLQIAGVVRELPVASWFGPTSPYGHAVRAVSEARGPAAPFAMGALTGLLPCPLVYAFLAAALASGGLLASMGVMSILGVTSMPALLLVGLLGASVSPQVRRRFVRVAGVGVVLLGVVTLLRGLGLDVLHAAFGHFHGA